MKNNLFNLISFVDGCCVINKNCVFCDSKLSSIIKLTDNNCTEFIDFNCDSCYSFSIKVERYPNTKTAKLINLLIKCLLDNISTKISIYNSCYFLYPYGLRSITQNISGILESIDLVSFTSEDYQRLINKIKKMSYYG